MRHAETLPPVKLREGLDLGEGIAVEWGRISSSFVVMQRYSRGIGRLISLLILVAWVANPARGEVGTDRAAEAGFTAIFDGKSLAGWSGDPVYWRVEDGHIVGEITPETLVKRNTFLIWEKDQPANFEFKLDY